MKSLLKRLSAMVLSLVITVVCLSVAVKADNDTFEDASFDETQVSELTASPAGGEKSYESVLAASDFSAASEDIKVKVNASIGNKPVSFKITVPSDGLYKLGVNYKGAVSDNSDFVFGLKIDGKYPFDEAQKLNLFRIFCNEPGGNRKDAQGNEFSPRQIPYDGYFYDEISDITRWSDDNYLFALKKGEHTVTLNAVEGSFEVSDITFGAPDNYEDYMAPDDKSQYYKGEDIIIEGGSEIRDRRGHQGDRQP